MFIKKRLIKNYLKKIIGIIGYRFCRISKYTYFDFESFLYLHLDTHKTLIYIQIGANDGVMNDPINKFIKNNKSVVYGYALEPLPDIFEKLKSNYKNFTNIKLFNLAIHENESEVLLHRVNPKFVNKLSEFASGIGSFDIEHWKKTSLVPNFEYMESIKVKCISFNDFVKDNSINKLDLLLLDTEGYDRHILKSINFALIKPKIIRFEHGLRNKIMTIDEFNEVCDYLNSNGYQIITETYDATAYLIDPLNLID